MEMIVENMPAGPERLAALIYLALRALPEMGWHPEYGIQTNVSITEIEARVTSDAYRVESQTVIDVALQTIARKLHNLFEDQDDIRRSIERTTGKDHSWSVSRSLMRKWLISERENREDINKWKKLFALLIEDAKHQGFEVFERDENKYSVYTALEISLSEVQRDADLKERHLM